MPDPLAIRPEIRDLKAYAHAVDLEAVKQRYGLERVIKLASNENPLGPPPLAQEAVRAEARDMSRYPDPLNTGIRQAVSEHTGVAPERIAVGNGSDDLIDLLVRVKARPGVDQVLTLDPCFDLYVIQSRIAGVQCCQVPLSRDLRFDFTALVDAADENTVLVYLTSPMNPTGQAALPQELAEVARALPQAVVIIDEAYIDFAHPRQDFDLIPLLDELPNLGVLRTFSKAWGLAGVRLGYAILPEVLADAVRRTQIPFNVNRVAASAGVAALQDLGHYQATLELTISQRGHVARELERLGCRPMESQTNFILFQPPRPAREVFDGLLERGVLIRAMDSAGLPDRLRVSIGLEEENRLFLDALSDVLSS
ncbi:MAG: histidinol-phosphate transaminase [Desulfovibrio sp.]|nr:MAG: histidinol-phosphate transaminase [Desulfovibrio sp.]